MPNNPNDSDAGQAESGHGQLKCLKCGATDISLNANTGLLRCNFCRHEFEPEKAAEFETNIRKVKGQIISSGAQDIIAGTDEILTLKCQSCAAEVIIDTGEVLQARCHWCRNTLSVQQQIPNGAVPDMMLPFGVKKDAAQLEIEKFVGKRKFFAHPKFKAEFTTENIMGVYLPYMVIDVHAHVSLTGQGEKQVRQYTVDKQTYYDADLYHVWREFDLAVSDLTIESSSDKLDNKSSKKTNNIINSIMPFDIENCVKWNANYLKGYTSEKRDTNVAALERIVNTQTKDIARHTANSSLRFYDRGVCWEQEHLKVHGQQWKAAYLPVWLYSYQQVSGGKKTLHYVAVNARTKETMGSVPIHMPKLISISAVVEVLGIFLAILCFILAGDSDLEIAGALFLFSGFAYFAFYYGKYRNRDARHYHETETKTDLQNLRQEDTFVKRRTRLTNQRIVGVNNTDVDGHTTGSGPFRFLKK
ncbi:MAG: hypothetical protein LBU81_02055 [Methanosarcinales archaeon]|jgi:hypothetical protein|nr:hypothetical protein [Methanosarcinales archaeon]